MAVFPNAISNLRALVNRAGAVYDAVKTKVFYAEDHNLLIAEVQAIETVLGINPEGVYTTVGLRLADIESDVSGKQTALGYTPENVANKNTDVLLGTSDTEYPSQNAVKTYVDVAVELGWNAIATIPTLQSSDDPNYVLRFGADMTGIFEAGQKIQLTQHALVKNFFIMAVGAYTGGNTDVTVYGGTDYDMESTATYAVTLPKFSIAKKPFGFPLNPAKWTVEVTDTSLRGQATPTGGAWYNIGGAVSQISIPIGIWNVSYSVCPAIIDATGANYNITVTLSTASNSESDKDLSCYLDIGSTIRLGATLTRSKILVLATKTLHYLNTFSGLTTIDNMYNRNDQNTMIIRAVCAYL